MSSGRTSHLPGFARALLVAAAAATALYVSLASAAIVQVTPGNPGDWITATTGAGAAVDFEVGPATPPVGSGSLSLSIGVDGGASAQARNIQYSGLQLDDLSGLTYSTHVTQWVDGQVPYVILNIDYTGDATVDDQIFFEPVYQTATFFPSNPQPAPVLNTWQTWDALNGGWWSVNGIAGAGPGTDVKTIAQYLAAEPDARIMNGSSAGIRIVAGFGAGSWDNFSGNVDNVTIQLGAFEPTTYDFDIELPRPEWVVTAKVGGGNVLNPFLPDYVHGTWSTKNVSVYLSCVPGDGGAPLDLVRADRAVTFKDGIHTYSTKATDTCVDEAGLAAEPIVEWGPIMVDTKAPNCSVSPVNTYIARNTTGPVQFVLDARDATSGLDYAALSTAVAGGASFDDFVYIAEGLPEIYTFTTAVSMGGSTVGRITFNLTAYDIAGNSATCVAYARAK
jgi:hypothetical protein